MDKTKTVKTRKTPTPAFAVISFLVIVAVLVALTLLPAIMGVFGGKVFGWQPGFLRRHQEKLQQPEARTLGRRWVETVHRVPGLFLVGVVIAWNCFSFRCRWLPLGGTGVAGR